jgi:hypothetical protein
MQSFTISNPDGFQVFSYIPLIANAVNLFSGVEKKNNKKLNISWPRRVLFLFLFYFLFI